LLYGRHFVHQVSHPVNFLLPYHHLKFHSFFFSP
jgi:hypothetical protein